MSKLARVTMSPPFLTSIFKNAVTVVYEGVPKDARVVGGGFDLRTNQFVLVLESEEFYEVPEGLEIPLLTIKARSTPIQ